MGAIYVSSVQEIVGESVYYLVRRGRDGNHVVLHKVHKGVYVDYNGFRYPADEYGITWRCWRQGVPTRQEVEQLPWSERERECGA